MLAWIRILTGSGSAGANRSDNDAVQRADTTEQDEEEKNCR
jgi:hypothetical protein